MLELDDVTLSYPDGVGRLTAVDQVSLVARPATVTAITGPSGSGKSSLLAVAATLIRPDSGRVVIDGVDASALSARDAARLRRERIGIVFQRPNLLPALTAREQLQVMRELGASSSQPSRAVIADRADEMLDAVGLADQALRRPSQLSGGQQQRVNIARALMHRPQVLLVDEPTSALDTERGAAIVELIVRLTRELGTATLLVTHDRLHASRVDGELRLVDGRVVARSGAAYAADQAA